MALRTFADRSGCTWNVWNVQPSMTQPVIEDSLKAGWLCFQRASGGERVRLRMCDVPPTWEELGDDRLDLLRRVAETESRENPDAAGISEESVLSENSARGRTSGPRAAVADE